MTDDLTTGWELVLNACEGVLQIAITENCRLVCYQEWHKPARATEILASALSEMCKKVAISPNVFRRIGCFTGPGSFTGIRLVLGTAAALRRVSSAQLADLDYLQSLACTAVMYRQALYPVEIAVITHARREIVHFQRFRSYGPQIPPVALGEVRLAAPNEALEELAGTHAIVCGSGLPRYPEIFALPITGQGPVAAPDLILLPTLVNPAVQALCLLARHGDYFPKDLEPRYTRGCDAVENLEREAGNEKKIGAVAEFLSRVPKSDI